MLTRHVHFGIFSGVLLLLGMSGGVKAQPASGSARTVLDGVYSDVQAARGKVEYDEYCARCHGDNLDDSGVEPPLRTQYFIDAWREDYLSSLFQFIETSMPKNSSGDPEVLDESQNLDIVAYILAKNEYPAGQDELARSELASILFVGHDGPESLPANAMVRAVGCLSRVEDDWRLENAAIPSRVRVGDETYVWEVEQSRQTPLGARGFRLTNLDEEHSDEALMGDLEHKVQVKGVLNGQDETARIYVLSYETLGQNCGSLVTAH